MNISPVVYDAVEFMVRLAAADCHVTAGELAAQVVRPRRRCWLDCGAALL